MKKYFSLALWFLMITLIHAQDMEWDATSSHGGNEAINGVAQTYSGDRYVVSMQNLSTSFFEPAGHGMISKYADNGSLLWNFPVDGQLYISNIVADNEHFWVCGHIDSTLIYNTTEIEAKGMFVMQCDQDGNPDWVFTNDSLFGHHSVLGLTPEGRPVVSALEDWNGKSVLTELDDSGDVIRTKDLPEAMISDFEFRENGDLVVGGVGFQVPNFDGITVEGFISYPNFLALFNAEWQTQWLYVSEYITFDHHHRVETLNDRVFFYAIEGDNFPLESNVLVFSSSGELLDSIQIGEGNIFAQMTELVTHADQLEVLHSVSNTSNPDFSDTLRITTYYPEMGLTSSYDITGEFPLPGEGRGLWKMDAKGCNTSLAGLTEMNTIQFGTDEEIMLVENDGHFAVVSLDMNCTVTGVTESDIALRIYPNPADDVIWIESTGQDIDYVEVININGKIVETLTIRDGYMDVSDLPSGIYVIRVQIGNASVYQRIVVQ